jgi:hypothetical protein
VVVEHPNRAAVQETLEKKQLDLRVLFPDRIEKVMLSNRPSVDQALRGQREQLNKQIAIEVNRILRQDDDVWSAMKKNLLVRDLSLRVEQAIGPALEGFALDVNTAVSQKERESLSVDVAVTKEELMDLPETIVSNVHLVTSIQNYEWIEVGEVSGEPVRRLRPE